MVLLPAFGYGTIMPCTPLWTTASTRAASSLQGPTSTNPLDVTFGVSGASGPGRTGAFAPCALWDPQEIGGW
jgi:hypothetical protein